MADNSKSATPQTLPIPPDDPLHQLATVRPETDQKIRHIGVVGDTYTILLTGKETAGQFCLIDMHVPPGGGPPHHRHDFEETFTLFEGELDVVFRGAKQVVRAGETIHVPANAPHQFHNSSTQPVRMSCICSPAGQEEFFTQIGVPVATVRRLRQSWMQQHNQSSEPRPLHLLRSIERNFCNTPRLQDRVEH